MWVTSTPTTVASGSRDNTRATETARRHIIENYEKDLKAVQVLEAKMNIEVRWTPYSTEWQDAGRLVAMRKYQRALDQLDGMVVARISEFAKMNRAGTGMVFLEKVVF